LFLRALRRIAGAGIVVLLFVQLNRIGWNEVLQSLPATPWFYVIVGFMYFMLPVAEALIYRTTWGLAPRHSFPALIRKRVYNMEVLNYSGEVYLFSWTRAHLNLTNRQIMGTIKDNTIISSITSTLTALLLLAVLLGTGLTPWSTLIGGSAGWYIAGTVLILIALVVLGIQYRKKVFSLPGRTLRTLFTIHSTRFTLNYFLQVLQWWIVLPDQPFQTWAIYLAVLMIVNRIPFLPTRDLIFVGLGVELAQLTGTPQAAVAGMLLVRSAIDKTLNLTLYLITTILDRGTRLFELPASKMPIVDAAETEGSHL
jgi:hypothetical protein